MMLKALVILIAIVIAVVNAAAQGTAHRRVVTKVGVVRVGPSTTYVKEGLSTDEVVKLLGTPTNISATEEIGVANYEFPRGEGRVLLAHFVNGTLVDSWIESRPNTQAGH